LQCRELTARLPYRVIFSDSPAYSEQASTYWASNQGHLRPACRVVPRTTSDVSTAVSTLRDWPDLFAIRSGGHSSLANTSNIDNGVAIDFSELNHIRRAPNDDSIYVGPGARWRDIYRFLESQPRQLGVAGARAGSVGVGGFILGGGLSIFSSVCGWSSNEVVSFEVVLPNASVVNIDFTSPSPLFRALKGSASNFGIVTSIQFPVYPDRNLVDVAVLSYPWSKLRPILQALTDFNTNGISDPYVTASASASWRLNDTKPLLIVSLSHLKSLDDTELLRNFTEFEPTNVLYDRMTQFEFSRLVDEGNPPGFCQHKSTLTSYNNDSFASDIVDHFMRETQHNPQAPRDDTAFQGAVLIQPLTVRHLQAPASPLRANSNTNVWPDFETGNILGLENEQSPLLLYSFELRHTYHHDHSHCRALRYLNRETIEHFASSESAHPFRYINYASSEQDVFAAFKRDEKAWQWLQEVKKEYVEDWRSEYLGGGGRFHL
jgi:FAD binding domain